MIDEGQARKDAARAAQAQAILDNPLFAEAFADLKQSYLGAWEASHARDTEAREKLWQAVQIVGKVKSHFEAVMANGVVARHDIEQLTAKPKRFGIV